MAKLKRILSCGLATLKTARFALSTNTFPGAVAPAHEAQNGASKRTDKRIGIQTDRERE